MTLRGKIRHMFGKVSHLIVDRADTATPGSTTGYKGNPYQSYCSQVEELARKFAGMADWGNQVTQNVVNIRSAFTIGSGVKAILAKPGHERELEFVRSFMTHNGLDAETAQDWVREAELEGKFLVRLMPETTAEKMGPKSPIPGKVTARFISWTTNRYNVETEPEDYTRYTRVSYKVANRSDGREVVLAPHQFVYRRFGGRADSVNDTPPRLGPVLRQLEDIDKGLYDWRQINSLFASPTPWIDAEDDDSAERLFKTLRSKSWKVGKLLITAGAKFTIVEAASGRGIESLEKEIIANAKFVSGASGVPVHFLGLPDLLSNRATADNLLELVVASTSRERRIWVGVYTEMFQEALQIANDMFNAGFDPESVIADVPFVSAAKMKELVEVWLPLYLADAIDIDTLLARIPEIDADVVKKRLDAKRAEDEAKAELAVSRTGGLTDTEDDDDNRL